MLKICSEATENDKNKYVHAAEWAYQISQKHKRNPTCISHRSVRVVFVFVLCFVLVELKLVRINRSCAAYFMWFTENCIICSTRRCNLHQVCWFIYIEWDLCKGKKCGKMNFENLNPFSASNSLAKIFLNRRKISLFLFYSLLKTAGFAFDSRFPIEKEKMNKISIFFEWSTILECFSRCIVSEFQTAALAKTTQVDSSIKDTHLIEMRSRKIWLTRVVTVGSVS